MPTHWNGAILGAVKTLHYYLARGSSCEVLRWVRLCAFVCVCVCLSVHEVVFGTTRAIFTKFVAHVAYIRLAVARSSSSRVTKSQGEETVLGFSSPLTMYCTAQHLETIQKRLKRARCRLRWWVGLARGTVCYVGVTMPEGEGVILGWEHMCPTSLTPVWIANWTGPCSVRRAHDRGRRLIASVGRAYYRPRRRWDCTPRAKSDIYDCLVWFAVIHSLLQTTHCWIWITFASITIKQGNDHVIDRALLVLTARSIFSSSGIVK